MARRRRKKIPQEPVRCTIESTSHDGRGVTHIDGKTIFIEGALAGEDVTFQYTEKRSKFDEGKTLEVHQASDLRVTPECEHATICGGCSLQHLQSDAQVQLKQDVLVEQFRHFGGLDMAELMPPLRSPTSNYRRKARLAVKYVPKKGGAMVGFREKRSPYVADIQGCTVLVREVGQIIPELRELITELECHRTLPQIEVAQGDDATALVFRHLEPLSEADQNALEDFCRARNLHLYLQPGGNDTVHRVWPAEGEERLRYRLEDFGVELKFHPMDFTQVNPHINRDMVALALAFLELDPSDKVLDLFCGLGNFTLPIATKAAQVVGVEGGEAMVVRGRENAQHNGLNNVEFFAADLTQPFADQDWAKAAGGFNKILIDPPRSGALEIVEKMTVFRPERIVYVSCNPATLARDSGELVKQGYRLLKTGIMDMFPHTNHVESIAVFVPAKAVKAPAKK